MNKQRNKQMFDRKRRILMKDIHNHASVCDYTIL